MLLRTKIIPHTLQFKRPAKTSRGVYLEHKVWYVVVYAADNPARWGIGECAPLFDLSCDYSPDYNQKVAYFCQKLEDEGHLDIEALRPYPSIFFGLETALKHFETQSFGFWDTPFSRNESGIPINGLIWMGDFDYMLQQIEEKLQSGFSCIKLKIGAIDFENELSLLQRIRERYTADQITIRVDANGAFSLDEAMDKLKRLSELDVHSIEQPIKAGQWEEMAKFCASTPLPIALDEELIGVYSVDDKKRLLETIQPQYIILKPTLHGGIAGAEEWIALADERNIGWWITSALESNIGLNAIAQWTASLNTHLPQGLGTGGLYVENIEMPLHIKSGHLWYDPQGTFFDPANIIREMYELEIAKQTVTIEGKTYTSDIFMRNFVPDFVSLSDFHNDLYLFLKEWFSDAPIVKVHTSGSTGMPKEMHAEKQKMMQSAALTCSFLGLEKRDSAFLCMPLQYIAGKMFVVRALVAGLDLHLQPPCGNPLKDINQHFHFAAMTPQQVFNTLQSAVEKAYLLGIENLIIGGGAISPQLEEELKHFPNNVYSTYGMTETLSHIALRRLNGAEASACYKPFSSVSLSLSSDGTLIIDAPLVADETLYTNDIAEIYEDKSFRIIGRKDNVINSGGLKIQVEELEALLEPFINSNFAITSVSDAKFGEIVVLAIEGNADIDFNLIEENLPPYYVPKEVIRVESIPMTETGKISRAELKERIKNLV